MVSILEQSDPEVFEILRKEEARSAFAKAAADLGVIFATALC
jgi:hypothetical protein